VGFRGLALAYRRENRRSETPTFGPAAGLGPTTPFEWVSQVALTVTPPSPQPYSTASTTTVTPSSSKAVPSA